METESGNTINTDDQKHPKRDEGNYLQDILGEPRKWKLKLAELSSMNKAKQTERRSMHAQDLDKYLNESDKKFLSEQPDHFKIIEDYNSLLEDLNLLANKKQHLHDLKLQLIHLTNIKLGSINRRMFQEI